MSAVSVKILASVLHMHSPGVGVGSDHQGLSDLLADVGKQRADGSARIIEAAAKREAYKRVYFPRIQYPRTLRDR
jgi:hypothetical protein